MILSNEADILISQNHFHLRRNPSRLMELMVTPVLHLKEGSIVDVIAPASACPRSELMGGLRYLKSIGLKPRVSSKIFGKTKIFANTDAERLKQLKAALLSPDSDAIWCVRGGYGTLR